MNALKLLWRQFSEERWPALVLAFAVMLLSALTASVPRLMATIDDRQLAQELGQLSAIQGDVTGRWLHHVGFTDPAADPWAPHREAFSAIRDAQPEPLRSLLTEPQFLATPPTLHRHTPPTETGYYETELVPLVDPDLPTHAELIDGAWPAMPTFTADSQKPAFEVAISNEAAQKMGWSAGQDIDGVLTVSGIFRPLNPDDKRAQHIPLEYGIHEPTNPDRGTALQMGAFLPPEYLTSLVPVAPLGNEGMHEISMKAWFTSNVEAIDGGGVNLEELSSQLTSMLAQRYPVAPRVEGGWVPESTALTSELGTALTRVASQQSTTRAMLAVAAAGPIAVGLALVALASRLVIQRRRKGLDLINARGVSHRQLRRLAAVEGLLLAIPAAVLGHLAATWAFPGATVGWSWILTGLVAALAAGLLAYATKAVGHHGRSDLSSRGGRWRVVTEALVVLGALAAMWRIWARPTEGADLLSAATPVLVALAACLLVLRLYPLPLRALTGWLRRRSGLTSFLGAARALRDPAGGVIPVVTVLLGSTLAVMSVTLLGTITTGTERATWDVNGSSINVSGPRIFDDTLESLQNIDGVTAVARLHDAGDNVPITVDGERHMVNLLLASGDLAAAYAVAPGGSPVPDEVFAGGTPLKLVVGDRSGIGTGTVDAQGQQATVVDILPTLPGIQTGDAWALADAAAWPGEAPTAVVALLAVAPTADADAVAAQVANVLPNSRITTVSAEVAQLRASATVDGLTSAFTWLAVATAILMALSIFGSQLLTGAERTYLAAILRTLGLKPGQLRALTAWEVGPAVVIALAVGILLGIGLAALMLAALDFSAITGGLNSPNLHLHWPSLLAVVGGLGATVAVAIGLAAWQAGRTNLAQELRIGEQR